ncbi:hypothetical protein OZY48_07685 [Aliarcobacter cryaerophilus]|uniref:hypothetical protein n=1 Tax=Aliarcobacter cryaerophilus TaxID=28198 RepID=UPI003BB0386C
MKNSKKILITFFISTIIFTMILSSFNFIIDPFQQYRKPTLYKTFYTEYNERSLNGGLAKTRSYSSIITGSSMTQNFLISKASEILPNPIKLTISGATAHEINLILNTAFKSNNEIKNILIGLDVYALSGKPNRLKNGDDSIPIYLYDYNYFNDIFYLANITTIQESIRSLLNKYMKNKNDLNWNYENMYQWQHIFSDNDFSEEKILKQFSSKVEKNTNIQVSTNNDFDFENLKNSFEFNFISLIQNNPNTNFIFFYPPYSLFSYKQWKEDFILNEIIQFKKYMTKRLSEFSNVAIYDFQSAIEITTNLNNYKDFTHYHQNINNWMIEQIKENNYLVTKDNIDEHLENLRKQIEEYDLNKSILD